MALLRAAAIALVLAGCYDPAVRDCTVTCHGAGECASGQVCGTDGYCKSPSAGTCNAADAPASEIDAPVATIDAPPADASPPDGMPAQLHITITGKGKVVDSTSTIMCNAPPGDCLIAVDSGASITLTAVASGAGHPFADWTTANCMGMGPTCAVTIDASVVTVSAKFN